MWPSVCSSPPPRCPRRRFIPWRRHQPCVTRQRGTPAVRDRPAWNSGPPTEVRDQPAWNSGAPSVMRDQSASMGHEFKANAKDGPRLARRRGATGSDDEVPGIKLLPMCAEGPGEREKPRSARRCARSATAPPQQRSRSTGRGRGCVRQPGVLCAEELSSVEFVCAEEPPTRRRVADAFEAPSSPTRRQMAMGSHGV